MRPLPLLLAVALIPGCFIDRTGTAHSGDPRDAGEAGVGSDGGARIDAAELDAARIDAAGFDAAGLDAGERLDAGTDAGFDAGPPPPPFCDDTDPSLLLCLRFENDLRDGSRFGNDASGSAAYTSGRVGDALNHRVGDTISIASDSSLVPSPFISIELFLRPDALPSSGRVGVIDHPGELGIFVHPGGDVWCSFESPIWLVAPAAVRTGAWTHVGCTYDGSTQRIYVDGALARTQPLTRSTSLAPATMRIGANAPDGEHFDGRIDELRYWGSTRTASEIGAAAGRR